MCTMTDADTTRLESSSGRLTNRDAPEDTPGEDTNSLGGTPMNMTVLRSASCIEGDTCPMIGSVDVYPDELLIVGRQVTDPAVLAEFASHIGLGEILSAIPVTLLPEVQRCSTHKS
jgi:hypothetical protein